MLVVNISWTSATFAVTAGNPFSMGKAKRYVRGIFFIILVKGQYLIFVRYFRKQPVNWVAEVKRNEVIYGHVSNPIVSIYPHLRNFIWKSNNDGFVSDGSSIPMPNIGKCFTNNYLTLQVPVV